MKKTYKYTDAEQLLYDIAYSYLNDSDETVKPDIQTCIDLINDYFNRNNNDPLKVSEETQSALNKIADASLRGSYPKSLNGLFSYATVIGCDVLYTEDGDIDVYEVSLKYGRQDDCYNETYEDVIFVRKDNLVPVVRVDLVSNTSGVITRGNYVSKVRL